CLAGKQSIADQSLCLILATRMRTNSLAGAQAQRDVLGPFHRGSQFFDRGDRRFVSEQAPGIFIMIGDVLPAFYSARGKRARTDADIVRATPVSAIVLGA